MKTLMLQMTLTAVAKLLKRMGLEDSFKQGFSKGAKKRVEQLRKQGYGVDFIEND